VIFRKIIVVAATAVIPLATMTAIPANAAPSLNWQPCGTIGAQCATLSVPLDWAHPNGVTINLALSKLPAADPSQRAGELLFNPGGPGGGGAETVEYGGNQFPAQLRDRFDLIGFDPRGVGRSTPTISCTQPPFDPSVTQFPATQAQFDRLVAHNRALGEDCLRQTGPLLGHLDTISVAHDLDAIRVALGESKITFLGLSYGTLIGNIYAHLYPQRVRAMVLDGPLDHTIGSARMVADENSAAEVTLQHFFQAIPGTQATFGRMLGRLSDADAEVVLQGVYEYLNLTSYWPQLATALQQAADGDTSMLVDAADNGPNSPDDPTHVAGNQAFLAIGCQDFPSQVHTFGQLRAQMTQAARTAPDMAGHEESWLLQAGCIGWPVPAQDPWQSVPVHGTPPILIVAGRYDPATPYPWGVGLARQISGSILLTRSTDGHTGFYNDPCSVQQEADYLVDPRKRPSGC
jgi:pimeloyl-ACP methyl ester carboxylesterase